MRNNKIRVIICGAAGNMGKQTARSILAQEDMSLVGCFDKDKVGEDLGELLFGKANGIKISDNLAKILDKEKPEVMVDFTCGDAAAENVLKCIENGVSCVVGATGISEKFLEKIRHESEAKGVPVLVAPNFSIGAVLMMKSAKEAAKYYDWAEIIELHHEKKMDAPSGTALRTAKLMAQERESPVLTPPPTPPQGGTAPCPPTHQEGGEAVQLLGERASRLRTMLQVEVEKIPGVRGGVSDGIRIHSVRLPGLLAHQEVICGGLGETLTIRHDSLSRECFMPGVMLAIRKVGSLEGLVTGLENIM